MGTEDSGGVPYWTATGASEAAVPPCPGARSHIDPTCLEEREVVNIYQAGSKAELDSWWTGLCGMPGEPHGVYASSLLGLRLLLPAQ